MYSIGEIARGFCAAVNSATPIDYLDGRSDVDSGTNRIGDSYASALTQICFHAAFEAQGSRVESSLWFGEFLQSRQS